MKQPWIVLRAHRLPASLRVDRRVPPALAGLVLATLALMVINIGVGEYPIPPLDVVRTVLHLPGAAEYDFIVNTLRLPRMLVAALVGTALGVAGAITQGLTRNTLASPDLLGISSGAGLVAVALIVFVPKVPAGLLPFASFGGGLVAAALIYLLAWRGGDSPMRLVLVGIGLTAVTSALTTIMITFGDTYDVQRALIWLTGSVYARSWEEFWPLLGWMVVFLPLALLLSRHLNVLTLGEDIARGLGGNVAAHRGLLLLTAVALAGATVAAAGTVGFVGLVAPHIARRLVGPNSEGALPVAGLVGALVVVAADLVGRTIVAPVELPCGLVTAAIGAPFFIYLLYRAGRA